MELMVVVVIIGILSGIVITASGNEWRRERVNTVALELAGWLEQVRGASLRATSATTSAGGCAITLSSLTSQPAGSTLASVSPTSCSPQSTFILSGVATSGDRYSTASTNGTSLIFTPRGSVITTNSANVDIKILLDGTSLLRCVRVVATLGSIRIGRNDAATGIADSCPDASFGGQF
ncbi:MAG: hypothetical protein ER33_11890 [Cyanobium sp. CACIAM 14]|nr:MAG: hypothetical protein ER33_11890 [Cyanobium sp. CACIAM 14]